MFSFEQIKRLRLNLLEQIQPNIQEKVGADEERQAQPSSVRAQGSSV